MQESDREMTLTDAAARTGLDSGFLDWALRSGLLLGRRDEEGRWRIADENPETPEPSTSSDAAPLLAARPESPAAPNSLSDGVATAAPQADDLTALRRQLAARDVHLLEKDRVIADLGSSLARLGESFSRALSHKAGDEPL